MADTDYENEISHIQGRIDSGTKKFDRSNSFVQELQRVAHNQPHVQKFLKDNGLERHGRNLF